MKIATVIAGLISAGLWLMAAFIRIPSGWDTDAERSKAERKIGRLNAAAATASAATAILSAFSN